MGSTPRGRLELTWMGKDQALIPTNESTYDYTWVDRDDPRACQTHYLIDEGHVGDRSDGGIHDNLLITGESGDVLEVLTREPSLAERYVGRVKCVYIDPPFNTEKTFAHYEDNLEHSVWLTMMRDRLMLLKKLLADDGSIWVHLDDSEVHRMRVLLDEVFGVAACASQVVWQKRTTRENRAVFSDNHDHLLVYTNRPVTEWRDVRNRLTRTDALLNPDNDPRGPWDSVPFTAQGFRPNQMYPITTPSGDVVVPPPNRCWSSLQSEFERLLADNRIYFPKGGRGKPRIKQFASEAPGLVPQTIWLSAEVGENDEAKREIQALFPGITPFDTPKPERLLNRIIHIATNPGEIVLDCFAGSGTTAAVAHKMGRRWVTCELLPDTVASFTRPRLEKVVAGEDQGGITSKTERVAVDELPEGMTPAAAQQFNSALTQAVKDDRVVTRLNVAKETARAVRAMSKAGDSPLSVDEEKTLLRLLSKASKGDEDTLNVDVMADAAKALRAATKTADATVVQWERGGGFDLARLSPVWVGVRTDTVSGAPDAYLVPEATGEVLARSVAAHLGFRWLPDSPRFAGRKGRQWLAVVEGMFTDALLDEFLSDIPDGDSLTVCCFGSGEGMDRTLRRRAKGSRLLVMPDDLFALRHWEA